MLLAIGKKITLIFFSLLIVTAINAVPAVTQPTNMKIPSKISFKLNTEYIRPFKLKKITIAEYITDPVIMYASLWGCFGLGLILWETGDGLNPGDSNYFDPDTKRGFDIFAANPGYVFTNRMLLEPFASNRIDPVTKEYDGMTVFRNDIYVKNIIEPAYFIYLALYMRAKDYHPAIMVVEIILLSVIYEFTVRPFFMNASFEQLLKNPAVGLVIAIFLDELSNFLLSTPYKGLHVLAYFLNPFNALPNSRIHPMLFFNPYKNTASIEAVIRF